MCTFFPFFLSCRENYSHNYNICVVRFDKFFFSIPNFLLLQTQFIPYNSYDKFVPVLLVVDLFPSSLCRVDDDAFIKSCDFDF